MNETMNFTLEEEKLIYSAVRYYQINCVSLNGKQYKVCDDILNKLFSQVYTQKQEQLT